MKKLAILLIALCLVLSAVPVAFANETDTTVPPVWDVDQCGENLRWSYADGVLTITGTGEMLDYDISEAPWAEYKDEMKKLVLSGVTYIGAEAFRDFDKLQYIDFGTAIKELGTRSFYGCDGLKELFMPMSFKVFGEESLRACKNLEKIHCDGGFPSFRLNCLWESYVTIYYPAERPWPVSLVQELEEAFHGRVEFIDSEGNDPYVPTEATEPETEPAETTAPPETTVPPTTVPETEPPVTERPVEAPTQAPETQPAEPAETAPPVTEKPAVPVESRPESGEESTEAEGGLLKSLKVAMLGLGVAAVVTVLAAVLMIFRKAGKKGKYEF